VLATILIALVAAIHVYILVLEMFLWDTKTGRKAFNLSADFARDTRVLAANQGLYNGFLAAGLLWGYGWAMPGFRSSFSSWHAC
jgi:putative membrane protein